MQQYKDLLSYILGSGTMKETRTGVRALSVFSNSYDLNEGFPLVTIKKTWFKGIVHELLWMLSGDTNIKYLQDNKVHIWDEWVDEHGSIGPGYGHQWKHWGAETDNTKQFKDPLVYAGIDQIADVIQRIKTNPNDRRLIVSAWNVSDLPEMRLPPCHCFFQFSVTDRRLDCQMYQRSADAFLGVPFNIAQYALLMHIIAQLTGLKVGRFHHVFGDLHIYENHLDQVHEILKREPKTLPKLELDWTVTNIDQFRYENIRLVGYESHPAVKGEVAV
jgi:thymidylate synthase